MHSCGTNTLASVPCMFSPLGKEGYESARDDHENLVDVAQAAGLAVLWIDNQPGGCKGVCDRVPHAAAIDGLDAAARAALCSDGECLDDAMLVGLDRRIEALPPERRARGVLLLMHQMVLGVSPSADALSVDAAVAGRGLAPAVLERRYGGVLLV